MGMLRALWPLGTPAGLLSVPPPPPITPIPIPTPPPPPPPAPAPAPPLPLFAVAVLVGRGPVLVTGLLDDGGAADTDARGCVCVLDDVGAGAGAGAGARAGGGLACD